MGRKQKRARALGLPRKSSRLDAPTAAGGVRVRRVPDHHGRAGGIVGRPTLFPMRNGGPGLMGEAGEEAIMSLRRGPSGRLGVSAHGVGGRAASPVIRLEVSRDTDLVRVVARDEAGNIIATAGPQIQKNAVKQATKLAPEPVASDKNMRSPDWRTTGAAGGHLRRAGRSGRSHARSRSLCR
jgi:hypothetical protein